MIVFFLLLELVVVEDFLFWGGFAVSWRIKEKKVFTIEIFSLERELKKEKERDLEEKRSGNNHFFFFWKIKIATIKNQQTQNEKNGEESFKPKKREIN